MARRVLAIAAGLLALAAIVCWMGSRPGATDPPRATPTVVPADGAVPVGTTTDASTAGGVLFETRLIPFDDEGAEPDSVRFGIGHVPPDQRRAYERWVLGGEGGAGPASYGELAQIEQWLRPPARRIEDAVVRVGPLALPPADRFELRARSRNPLVSYAASFTASAPPEAIHPTLAAGLSIVRAPVSGSQARLLFRRVDAAPDAARWQAILGDQAPELLAAYDETGLILSERSRFGPLPPGPLDLVLQVDGVEAERRRVELVAGAWTEVQFDDVSQAVARAVSVDLELVLVVAGTTDPVDDIGITWHAESGDQLRVSDAQGVARFDGLDRQRTQRFTLQFPASNQSLPTWPETRPLELELDRDADETEGEARVVRKTIELTPLRWLEVDTGDFPIPVHRQGGQPYPIFVLQRERAGQWTDIAADHFLLVPGGIAVSVQQDGAHRLVALRSPWSVRYSSVAMIERGAVTTHRAQLLPAIGQHVEITVLHEGVPLAHTDVALRGPARGLPSATLTTDAAGRLRLEEATATEIGLEVPGYLAQRVDLRAPVASVELQVDAEASAE